LGQQRDIAALGWKHGIGTLGRHHDREATNRESEVFYSSYWINPNHFLCVPIMWKPANHGDPFFKSLRDYEKNYEQVILFVGYVSWVYLQLGGGFQKASWANTEEASHLSITLDNNSQFNDAYMEKLRSIEKDLIQECMDFIWAGGTTLTLKNSRFSKRYQWAKIS
jgi:hypothetical protein